MGDNEQAPNPTCILHAEKLAILEKNMAESKEGISKILKLIQGNGTMGIATKAHLAYEEMTKRIEKQGNMKFDIYRFLIFLILSFIAVKVGLK